MRVVSGSAKGRRLTAPDGLDVRPTTDRVKEAMFSIIQFELAGSNVLDLFAGSGQLGIEALSRGAIHATFTDSSKKSIECIKNNIATAGMNDKSEVVFADAFSFLSGCRSKFDIVLLDPPYEKKLCDRAFELLPAVIKKSSVVICETRANEVLPQKAGELELNREYVYSAIKLSVFRAVNTEE